MRDSSFGGPRRKDGDCGSPPAITTLYNENITGQPVVENGVLLFRGGKSFDTGLGIGFNGSAEKGVLAINYEDILKGGSGVKIRQCGEDLTKKVRLKCCENLCNEFGERLEIQLQKVSSCRFPEEDIWVQPYFTDTICGCISTCCQRLRALAKVINADENSLVTAEVVSVGADPETQEWFLELTSKAVGKDFRLVSYEGLKEPVDVVPFAVQKFTAKDMVDWFPEEIISQCTPNKCLTVVEIWAKLSQEDDEASGRVTSNYLSPTSPLKSHVQHYAIVFDTSVSGISAKYTALITALGGGNNNYLRVAPSGLSATVEVTYNYCLARTDAGDATALTAATTAYVTGSVTAIGRSYYVNGKSYYTLTSTSATPPTPVSESGDTVAVGICNETNLPCNSPDGCPEPTP